MSNTGSFSDSEASRPERLVKLGYFPLPCSGKVPIGVNWQYRTDPFDIPFTQFHNIGVRCGDGGLLGVDVDIEDRAIGDAVEGVMSLFGAPVRFGRVPRRLLACRTAEPTKSRDLKYEGNGKKFTIQLIGERKQFIGFGVHPDTKQDYFWKDRWLLDMPLAELPLVDVDCLIREIDAVMAGFGFHRRIVVVERDRSEAGAGHGDELLNGLAADERAKLVKRADARVERTLDELAQMAPGTGRGGESRDLGLRIGWLADAGMLKIGGREEIKAAIFAATNDDNAAFHSFDKGCNMSSGEWIKRVIDVIRLPARVVEEAKAMGLPTLGFSVDVNELATNQEATRARIVEELEAYAPTLKGSAGNASRRLKADRRRFRAMVEAAATPVSGIGVTQEQAQHLLKAAGAAGPNYAPKEKEREFGEAVLELAVNGVSVDDAFARVALAARAAVEANAAKGSGPWILRNIGSIEHPYFVLDPKSTENHEFFLTHPETRYGLGLTLRYDTFRRERVVSGGNENLDPDTQRILIEGSIEAVERALEAIVNSNAGNGVWASEPWATNKARLGDYFLRQAEMNAFDSAVDALEALPGWDGRGRLTAWLPDALGYPEDHVLRAYVGAVGEQLAKSVPARIQHPGCKLDEIPVLLGPQGQLKSWLGRLMSSTIVADGFVDGLNPDASPKEVLEITAGKIICELPELRGLHKRDVDKAKAFASRQSDRAREAYARDTSEVARRFVCIATANLVPKGMTPEEMAALPDKEFVEAVDAADASFLVDDTGNRRWLPVRVRVKTIDVDTLKAILPQVYAEAILAVDADVKKHGSPQLYLKGAAAQAARAQQAQHVVTTVLQDVIAEALEGLGVEDNAFVPVADINHLVKDRLPRGAGPKQIETVMNRLGWIKRVGGVKVGKLTIKGYVRKTKQGKVAVVVATLTGDGFSTGKKPDEATPARGNVLPIRPPKDAASNDRAGDASSP